MVELAVAVQVAGAAYNAIKGAVEKGQEAQNMIGAFGKFFDSMDAVSEANIKNQSPGRNPAMAGSGGVGLALRSGHVPDRPADRRTHGRPTLDVDTT